MMRRVLVTFAVLAAAACQPGERVPGTAQPPVPTPVPTPTPEGVPRAEPRLRVGIAVDTNAVQLAGSNGFTVTEEGGAVLARVPAAEVWTFSTGADGVSARGASGSFAGRRRPLRISPEGAGNLTIAGRPYRGDALIIERADQKLTAVNVVELEAYLQGVVPRELGKRPASEIEALKAQAVASRTYAVGNLGSRSSQGFDVYATVMDQVYGGLTDEDSIVSRAVRETAGEIMMYEGRPILAYYASTCGGTTAAIEDSWPTRAPLPYLRSVSDQVPGTDQYYCSSSNRFNWTTRWTRAQLLAVLSQTLRSHTKGAVTSVRRVDDVRIVDRNKSDRATVRVTADGRDYTLRADSVRWVLRPQPGPAILNSSRLYALEAPRDDGGVTELEIRGGGWGHAIGMCQVGAMGRARAGQSYSQILRAYYTGVELRRLY